MKIDEKKVAVRLNDPSEERARVSFSARLQKIVQGRAQQRTGERRPKPATRRLKATGKKGPQRGEEKRELGTSFSSKKKETSAIL